MLKISVLTNLRGHYEALAILQRIAAEVTPIMRSRGWIVQNYMEFLPDDPGLLGINVNRGEEVKIRLRQRMESTTFIEYRELVGTTLHELCHLRIGPHDTAFYKLYDELWSEYENMEALGTLPKPSGIVAGASPDSGGHRLGGDRFRGIPAREAALAAAQKRARIGSLSAGSGQKLGGGPSTAPRPLTPAERRALLAAAADRRRAVDDKTCGVTPEGFREEELHAAVAASLREVEKPGPPRHPEVIVVDDEPDDEVEKAIQLSMADAGWVCPDCTFSNPGLLFTCDMCGFVK